MRVRSLALAATLAASIGGPALAAGEEALPRQSWSFSGLFGTFDRASAQRGFQVYKEVCSGCHSMREGYYRNLEGIGLNAEQIKAIAATVTVPDLKDDGTPGERPALPSDHFRAPFANDLAARAANNGALPPDQSVIINAREDGPNYVDALLQGYSDPPAGMKVGEGLYYNRWFPGHQIAMPQPLRDNSVTYADGTPASLAQESHDIVTFLTYMANPEMEERKKMGVKVVFFLALLTGVTYVVKRKVWADVH